MDEMPDFDTSHETPTDAPKKPRRKPMKRRKMAKHRTPMPKRLKPEAPKKTRKKWRKARSIPAGRRVLAEARGMNHTEFMAAFRVVTALAKFYNDAKKRILAKAAEAWT